MGHFEPRSSLTQRRDTEAQVLAARLFGKERSSDETGDGPSNTRTSSRIRKPTARIVAEAQYGDQRRKIDRNSRERERDASKGGSSSSKTDQATNHGSQEGNETDQAPRAGDQEGGSCCNPGPLWPGITNVKHRGLPTTRFDLGQCFNETSNNL